ncbi:uncharacterized protein LOC125659286 isoform X1 [Ostrea edulis]|uniref:uncharacterized protein LOC125659286 isoform X1 n=1 Tax=Ostrea edulis TaxID=37623 RepID=UPI0024AED13F|nr:uncharacterized protein LOC125659286 isoform X1 [Ostrea edulis]
MKAEEDSGTEQIDMSGTHLLCWGLLLLNELGSYYLTADMNSTNSMETVPSTTKGMDLTTKDLTTTDLTTADYSTEDAPSTTSDVDPTTADFSTELGSYYLTADMNSTNSMETVPSTTKGMDLTTKDLTTTDLTTADYSTEDAPSTTSDVDPTTADFSTGVNSSEDTSTAYTDVTTAAPPTVNCTSIAVNVQHVTPLDETYLYIGSTATVRVYVVIPVGFIEELRITLIHDGENVDFDTIKAYHTGNMDFTNSASVWKRYYNTSFQRFYKTRFYFYNITTSYSNSTENRLLSEFYVYLHNAKGLQDGQNISIDAKVSYQWNGINLIECPVHPFNFTTKTLLLKMNKTASFAMVAPKTSELPSGINLLNKITFRAWVPDYNPSIKVLLQRHTDSLWIAYLRVPSVGFSYRTNFADIRLLKVSSCGANTSLLIEFPSHWVNRGYYKYSKTTAYDMIEFEAGIMMTKSADLDSEQTVRISILLDDVEVWISTVSLKVNSTVNADSLVKMSIVDDLVNGPIVSSSNIPLMLVIETPANTAEILNIRLWTGNLLETGEPAAIIKNVSFHRADENITCYDLNALYHKTENSSVQNSALIHLKYVNSATDSITSFINLTFEVNVVQEKMNFADMYVVFVALGTVTSKYTINMKLPEILKDRNNTLLGQFHKLLDGDNSTCVDLPVMGNFPPLFWTRVHTAWFRINASTFEITLIGKDISCQRNGYKISQVSIPTSSSKNGFHGDLKFCDVTYNGGMDRNISKCVYNCQCKNQVECSEVILFMADRADASNWNLCELSAVNV